MFMRVLLTVTGMVFLAGQAFSAYLPSVGPAPLRSRPTVPRVAVAPAPEALPVKPAVDVPHPSETFTALTPPTNVLVAVATNAVVPGPEEPIVSASPAPIQPSTLSPVAADPVTPQMMLEYFQQNGGTNGPVRGISVPMLFLPPVPIVRPDSSAGLNPPAGS